MTTVEDVGCDILRQEDENGDHMPEVQLFDHKIDEEYINLNEPIE